MTFWFSVALPSLFMIKPALPVPPLTTALAAEDVAVASSSFRGAVSPASAAGVDAGGVDPVGPVASVRSGSDAPADGDGSVRTLSLAVAAMGRTAGIGAGAATTAETGAGAEGAGAGAWGAGPMTCSWSGDERRASSVSSALAGRLSGSTASL